MIRYALAILTLLLGPLDASPLYAQQMSEEVAILHRVVFERDPSDFYPDPMHARELGLRYLEGRGVERDEMMGCALLFLADDANKMKGADRETRNLSERLFDEHCGGRYGLTDEEFIEAVCGTVGPPAQIFHLEPGGWVEIGRGGIAIDRPSGRTRHSLPNSCGHHYLFARPVSLPQTADGSPKRLLIEILSWVSGIGKQGFERYLEWLVMEIVEAGFDVPALELFVHESGSRWPTPPLPEPYQNGASFTVTPDGIIHWRFDTDPPRTGTIGSTPQN